MAIPITVPRLGWSMDEGTFVGWLKKNGESVKAGEPLFTLEGDKAAQDIEATDDGILRIPANAPHSGDTVSVGSLLGYLVSADEIALPAGDSLEDNSSRHELSQNVKAQEFAASSEPSSEHAKRFGSSAKNGQTPSVGIPAAQDQSGSKALISHLVISPRARRRAAELGLDCRGLKGTGRFGRIIEADVLEAMKKTVTVGSSSMRRSIAKRTTESVSKAPHFYLRTEVDASALLEFRDRHLPEIEQTTGVRLTLTDLLLRAQALALRDCPFANAIWQDDKVVPVPGFDVGLVVGFEDGLLIPIVRGADTGGLAALAKQRASLVEAARTGKIIAEDLRGGATSLSNLGKSCVDEFAAVIAAPQSSILAAGRTAPRPFVVDGQLTVRTTIKLCLSVDHRVMDGGPAAKFLSRIVERIVHP